MEKDSRKIISVFELNRRAKFALEDAVGLVWVEGEISRFTKHASGHWYFTLKDSEASVACTMFKGSNSSVPFEPRDGMLVRVFAKPTLFELRGAYQISVMQMEEAGKGSLQAQFEKLKAKLHAEGLFDQSKKKPIPKLPNCIAVVTSPTGAAIRDILHVINRRFSNVRIIIAPVLVQGPKAAQSVANAIKFLNAENSKKGESKILNSKIDVMIVGRGGGSMEDLWAFNEEILARAIFDSEIPVISAVGHEIDFTISDFVADLRAPTPSAAAEYAVPEKIELTENIAILRQRLSNALIAKKLRLNNRLITASSRLQLNDPRRQILQLRQKLIILQTKMRHALKEQTQYEAKIKLLNKRMSYAIESELHKTQQQLDEAQTSMQHQMELYLQKIRQSVAKQETALRVLSPLAVLDRGYSLTTSADGNVIKSASDLVDGQEIITTFADGKTRSRVI